MPTSYIYTGDKMLLQTARQQFYGSRFRLFPARVSFKTNKAKWAKQ